MCREAVRRHRGAGIAILTALVSLLSAAAHAQEVRVASTTATLSIVVPPVEHVPSGQDVRRPAVEGMNLAEGDRIVTGSRAIALVTFLDGSTVTVQPDSDVAIARAAVGAESTGLSILIRAGRVWARVARLLGRRSSITLESNEYAATARDGLIGAERSSDGTFACWTRASEVAVIGRDGRQLARLSPGEKATVAAGTARTSVEAFRVHATILEVETSTNVLPLLQVPDTPIAAGFVPPGIEVNQIFGSRTERGDVRWLLDVPAGATGVYVLALTGLADGPFSVDLAWTHNGAPVVRHRLKGRIARGQQLVSRLEPRFEDVRDGQTRGGESTHNPRTGRVAAARISPAAPASTPVPVKVVVSPLERASLERGTAH